MLTTLQVPVTVQYAPINVTTPSTTLNGVPVVASVLSAPAQGMQIVVLHLIIGPQPSGLSAYVVQLQSSITTSVCTGGLFLSGSQWSSASNPLGIFACAPGEGLDIVLTQNYFGSSGASGQIVYIVIPALMDSDHRSRRLLES